MHRLTINKYLGNQYVVKSSIGHIRDLPTSGSANKEPVKRGKAAAAEAPVLSPKEKAKRQLITRMGVDPEHGWKAKYEILPSNTRDSDSPSSSAAISSPGTRFTVDLQRSFGGRL